MRNAGSKLQVINDYRLILHAVPLPVFAEQKPPSPRERGYECGGWVGALAITL
jgi:hypothetical protein